MYHISKCYKRQYDIKTINLIIGEIFGPGDHTDVDKVHSTDGMIIRMIGSQYNNDSSFEIWGTGKPIREKIFIDDVCELMYNSLNIDEDLIEPVNIAEGNGYAIIDSARYISKSVGYSGELTFDTSKRDGAKVKILSNKKFKKIFGEYNFTDHQEAIDKTVKYYKGVLNNGK